MNSSALKLTLRVIPVLILVALVGWCSSGQKSLRDNSPIRAELSSLFLQMGALDGSSGNADLPSIAKNIGSNGMNRMLYESAPSASLDALKWMIKHGADPKNVGNLQGASLLQQVAGRPTVERLEFFMNLGLDPLERSADGKTLLHVAAENGLDEKAMTLLLSKGLKVTDIDASGKSPIHHAAMKSLALLVAAGAEVNARDNEGRTALHLAALNGRNDTAAELIRLSASVFEADKMGRTPLHYAAMGKSDVVVATLLAAGAPKTVRDSNGMTPKDIAVKTVRARRHSQTILDQL